MQVEYDPQQIVLGNYWMSFGQAMILGKCMAKVLMWVNNTGRRSTDRNHHLCDPPHIQPRAECYVLNNACILADLLFLSMELKNQEWLLSAKSRNKPGQEAAL